MIIKYPEFCIFFVNYKNRKNMIADGIYDHPLKQLFTKLMNKISK